jgi:hypothetical protein
MRHSRAVWPVMLIALLPLVPSCAGPSPALTLEEHPLAGKPQLVPLQFDPIDSDQASILLPHAGLRAETIAGSSTTIDGFPAVISQGDSQDLMAVLATASGNPPRQAVRLERAGEVVFRADAGLPSPVFPLQSLWSFNGHWALEFLYADEQAWRGELYIDGESMLAAHDYDEAFAFQILGGRPFYLYRRNGLTGYSYAGEETGLPYSEIPHYYCCAESSINPLQAERMIAFFARNDESWYYVELGLFED